MQTASRIIAEFVRAKNPLAANITTDEIPSLMEALQKRLNVDSSALDQSPNSLQKLDQLLGEYLRLSPPLNEEETVMLARELAAYFGQVLTLHAGGRWSSSHNLWGSYVVIGGATVEKEGRKRGGQDVYFSTSNIAAVAIERVGLGRSPGLYKQLLEAQSRRFKEQL
jgi:hypothetical protein